MSDSYHDTTVTQKKKNSIKLTLNVFEIIGNAKRYHGDPLGTEIPFVSE